MCGQLGHQFVGVIDPKTPSEVRSEMLRLGAQLEFVHSVDQGGGYLLSRLKRVRELCARLPDCLWTDQYSNPANPDAHYRSTAPEILAQMNGKVDAIFVAVSTGGTLAGIKRYFSDISPTTSVIGVDAIGSVALGGEAKERKLTGIGSSQLSVFLRPLQSYVYRMVTDRDAFAICRALDKELHLRLGGSSGAVICACVQSLVDHCPAKHIVCVCPDGGKNYESTIFNDDWLYSNHFDPQYRLPFIEAIRGLAPAASQVV